jgi:hypothetical protein
MPAVPIMLSVAARFLGGLTSDQFQLVLRWVEAEAKQDPAENGFDKAARVIERLRTIIGNKDNHVLRTVVQIAYTVAKLKGMF